MPRMQVRYTGRVQGVGFRATARDVARHAGVTGWVRNEVDQSVLLEAQGTADDLTAFLSGLGDRMGRKITGVDRTPVAEVEGESEFEIRFA